MSNVRQHNSLLATMKYLSIIIALLVTSPSFAQKLPAPSREVYKCEQSGKVVYSDSPCLGAKRVDVEPTRGLDRSSGTERVGTDVRKERTNEHMAEALSPIFGETAEQRAKRHRRAALLAKAQAECRRLDDQIPLAEETERASKKKDLPAAQAHLLKLRQQYRESKC